MPRHLPEIKLEGKLAEAIENVAAGFDSLDSAEEVAFTSDISASLQSNRLWTAFCDDVSHLIDSGGYAVVRGINVDGGRTLLVLSRALGPTFDTYGKRRIVKRFRMSPWTNELSHTIRRGDFHTDSNVSAVPPAATAMQCEVEDPGAPAFAEQRVAFLPDILTRLRGGDRDGISAFKFLMNADAEMARETSMEAWRGKLVQNGVIRYHPQSLRIAQKRRGGSAEEIESVISAIHAAAIDVSIPFHTSPGDTVLVSNRIALHYRGECSVRFTKFPTEFDARSLFVLHMKESSTRI